jgi:hypothetical protein
VSFMAAHQFQPPIISDQANWPTSSLQLAQRTVDFPSCMVKSELLTAAAFEKRHGAYCMPPPDRKVSPRNVETHQIGAEI